MGRTYAGVFFDSGGTIYGFDGEVAVAGAPTPDAVGAGAAERATAALRCLGYTVTGQAVAAALEELRTTRVWRERTPRNEESLIAALFEALDLPVRQEEVLWATGVYSGPRYRAWVFPHVHEVLARIKAAGLATGIIANTNVPGWIMDRNFRGAGVLEFLDTRLYSGDEGVSKPDPELFARAAARAGRLAPGQLVYVGNSVEADIKGARGAGWTAVLLRSSAPSSDGLADFEIDSWDELPAIVLG